MRETRCVVALMCLIGFVGLAGCAPPRPPRPAAVSPTTTPGLLPPRADGIAFVREGAAYVVDAGSVHEVIPDGTTKVAVGYSADGQSLLVTEERATRRRVLAAPVAATQRGSVLLDYGGGSTLGGVRAVPSGQLYYSVYGDPATRLVSTGVAPASTLETIRLRGTFSGEFDVDANGAIAYTGSGQNPASLILRTGASERPLAFGFALAFTPAFSRDRARVCFTGSRQSSGPIAVWVVDRDSGGLRVIPGTESLKPTYPAFSPDGARVAFRSALDGSIWIASLSGGDVQKLELTCDEAPLGW